MTLRTTIWHRLALVLVTAALAIVGFAQPASAADNDLVKYTVVTARGDTVDRLSDISTRYLGTVDRVDELLALNKGRRQPDGGALTDPDDLRPGWLIVLPWDAIGAGVRYGLLPTSAEPAAEGPCGGLGDVPATIDNLWGQRQLAADNVWARGRGDGVAVAIVDSGVDWTVPALSTRVMAGADISAGSTRGNVDCLGTGTAMAALIVAQPAEGASTEDPANEDRANEDRANDNPANDDPANGEESIVGIAPGATVMPVRIVTTSSVASGQDAASAIDVAVSAGVKVIALGSYVDLSDQAVLDAVGRAGSHDVVVVAGAGTAAPLPVMAEVVRVAAVGIDGALAEPYAAGGVDVVAPGVNVASLGLAETGSVVASGTQYAVAMVAGQAALIRAADPAASAASVVRWITQSAQSLPGTERPDPRSGWGLIDLAASLSEISTTSPPPAADPAYGSPSGQWLLWTGLAITGVALLGWIVRRKVSARHDRPARTDDWDDLTAQSHTSAATVARGHASEDGVDAPRRWS